MPLPRVMGTPEDSHPAPLDTVEVEGYTAGRKVGGRDIDGDSGEVGGMDSAVQVGGHAPG